MRKLFTLVVFVATLALTHPANAGGKAIKVNRNIVITYDNSGCYIVQQGDTLSGIAKAWLGNDKRWPEIYRWHRARGFGPIPKDPRKLQPGAHLWLHDDSRKEMEEAKQ